MWMVSNLNQMSGKKFDSNAIDLGELSGSLGNFLKDLQGSAEKAKKVLANMPSLNVIEKKQVGKASVSLLDHGGVLIEFKDEKSAKDYYNSIKKI